MGEAFEVEPNYVSGYGALLSTEKSSLGEVADHVYIYAFAVPEHYTGVLSLLETPVSQYADSVWGRLGNRLENLGRTAEELQQVASSYLEAEEENAETFQGESGPGADADPVSYPSSSPEMPTLEIQEMDFSAELQELSLTMFWIVWFLKSVLGYAPHNDIIEKVAGNWHALDVAGDALINAGNGAELVASSVKDGLTTLDAHWDGGAAQACVDYVTRLYQALGEEGPLNRTVGQLYKLIAAEAIEAIRQIIRDLKLPTDDIADKLGYVRVCFAMVPTGAGSITDAMESMEYYKELFDAAKSMVETIENVVEEAKEFLETVEKVSDVSDPSEAVENMINHLAPWGQEAKDSVASAADLADLADPSEFANTPTDEFDAGDDLERDGD